MHLTGDYVPGGGEFSGRWLQTTDMYIHKIKDLTGEKWTAIFQALHRLQESRARDEQIEIGARPSLEEHESLLSEDPPSPSQSSD